MLNPPLFIIFAVGGAANACLSVGIFQQFLSQLGSFSFPVKDSWVGIIVGIALMACRYIFLPS